MTAFTTRCLRNNRKSVEFVTNLNRQQPVAIVDIAHETSPESELGRNAASLKRRGVSHLRRITMASQRIILISAIVFSGISHGADRQWFPLPVVSIAATGTPEPDWTRWPGDDSTPWNDIHSRVSTSEESLHEASHLLMGKIANHWNCYTKNQITLYCMKGRTCSTG